MNDTPLEQPHDNPLEQPLDKALHTPLWTPTPERAARSNMRKFADFVEERTGKEFGDYAALHEWSVDQVGAFWNAVWDFADIRASVPAQTPLKEPAAMPGAEFFPGARLNFAENLLRRRDDTLALIFRGEDQPTRRLTYNQLYAGVAEMAAALRKAGIQAGDRVAGFTPNMPETIIAMLAATSIGAVWSSCSPDFGIQGVLDRFGQIKPRVLFCADGYFFKGKAVDSLERAREIAELIPEIEHVVVMSYANPAADVANVRGGIRWGDFTSACEGVSEIEFEQLPFNHPLYIMYSSGTTGLPKCMVQGPGVLLNHLKELLLHTDLRPEDRIFYFTTCGWMMWNWLVSALAVGATLVLFDGNPFHPGPGALWQLAQDEGITIFGTSARYLKAVEEAGLAPGEAFDLSAVRTLLSTGSPLAPEQFQWCYEHVKTDMLLASISGGTDLNGCFALGNPLLPVYSGELQCRGLGMKVEVYDESGNALTGKKGELVCSAPFPSMPLHFWDDEDGRKYRDAYFDMYPGIWRHGDYVELTERGGLIVHGRSDATLNPGGVRIGTADIYSRLEKMPAILDSVVVGQSFANDVRVILFVVMNEGRELNDDLIKEIKMDIRENVSPRHVPARIVAVPDIPYTLNMKKVELAVRNIIEGREVLNRDALRNPESLEHFRDLPELQS